MDIQPDIIYYNLSLICRKNNPTDPDVIAKFQEGRQDQLLTDAKNYTFSITKFTLNSNNLPILIPKIQTGQPDINLTSYGMMINYNDGTAIAYTVPYYLEYDCRNKYFNNYVNPPLSQQDDNQYYYMLNLQHFVDMFNSCLSSCYANIQQQVTTLPSAPPELVYNNDNTFSIYFNVALAGSQQFQLCLNDDLYNILRNFNYKVIDNNGFNHQFIITQRINNIVTINTVNYVIEKQFYPSLDNWSPVQSIVFQTSILGINPERVSAPLILSNNNSQYNMNVNNTDDILTDITLAVDNPCDYNSFIMYNANVYREANIIQDKIQKIDMNVGWKNKYNGKIYNILLSDQDEITAKIKFERRKIKF